MRGKTWSTGILFLQETHSSSKVEQKWNEDFKDHVFFSHGKTNSCDVLTRDLEKDTFNAKKRKTDKEGRILILDLSASDSEYISINLYNANIAKKHINVFSNKFALLKKFDINKKTDKCFKLLSNSKLDAQGANPTMKKSL